jgi:aryl-alcohol dehydrogenase-like predicted oxidoreductase
MEETILMQKRQLGKNGPELSIIGLGAWAIGGSWAWGWGENDDQESIRTIQRAIDLGVNWIDTAPIYGHGHSEKIVGQAIKGRRDKVFIATKCGLVWDDQRRIRNDITAKSIRQEVEASLERLGVDVIDLYQIHWPYANHSEAEAWRELSKLKKEGKVRWIGVSNFDVPLLTQCEKINHIDSLQPPYSLFDRHIEENILPFCKQNNIGVIPYSPMFSGLLSGRFDRAKLAEDDWRTKNDMFNEPQLSQNLEFVNKLRTIADKYNKTVGHIAVAWILAQPGITSAIVGARTVQHIEENVLVDEIMLTAEDFVFINEALNSHQFKIKKH